MSVAAELPAGDGAAAVDMMLNLATAAGPDHNSDDEDGAVTHIGNLTEEAVGTADEVWTACTMHVVLWMAVLLSVALGTYISLLSLAMNMMISRLLIRMKTRGSASWLRSWSRRSTLKTRLVPMTLAGAA